MITLPEHLEREFAAFRMRIDSDVAGVVDLALTAKQLRRDDEDNPDLVALVALLGLSAVAILNQAKLKARLTRIARALTREKQFEFMRLLGRFVSEPSEAATAAWVDEQARHITRATQEWMARAADIVQTTPEIQVARASIVETVVPVQRASAAAASAAILALTATVVGALTQANGLTHYRWETEGDDRVRDHHAALDGTIQAWASPPVGGGTYEDEAGHPLSGYGCRCMAAPIA